MKNYIYILFDSTNSTYKIYNQNFLKQLSNLEDIQDNIGLTLNTVSKISSNTYRDIMNMMCLHREALEEGNEKIFSDFDSHVYYRLTHNMIWSEINLYNIESYLAILKAHELMSFEDISQDPVFKRSDVNTLYVPKDNRRSDSVLVRLFEKKLKSNGCREMNDLYEGVIEMKNNLYYHNGNPIKNIVFLFDNFEIGTATIRTIKAYLEIKGKNDEQKKLDSVRNRCQEYYLNGNKVSIREIIDKNNCSIKIYSYYGTEEGKTNIEDFIKIENINNIDVIYANKITSHSKDIKKAVEMIWPDKKVKPCYTVIRELNMPKINVFPDKMLEDPKKAICMFVKKREIKY